MTLASASFDRAPRYPALRFLHEAHGFYARHLWAFIKIIGPAALVSGVAALATSTRANAILAGFPPTQRIQHLGEVFASVCLRASGWFFGLLVNVFAFGAVCAATQKINCGISPSAEESYNAARERIGRLSLLAAWLFGLIVIAFVGSGIVSLLLGLAQHKVFSSSLDSLFGSSCPFFSRSV